MTAGTITESAPQLSSAAPRDVQEKAARRIMLTRRQVYLILCATLLLSGALGLGWQGIVGILSGVLGLGWQGMRRQVYLILCAPLLLSGALGLGWQGTVGIHLCIYLLLRGFVVGQGATSSRRVSNHFAKTAR